MTPALVYHIILAETVFAHVMVVMMEITSHAEAVMSMCPALVAECMTIDPVLLDLCGMIHANGATGHHIHVSKNHQQQLVGLL